MQFTLTYRGPLPPTQRGISSVKARLRAAFHPQVKSQVIRLQSADSEQHMSSAVGGYHFISPAHARFRTSVELDVLLLTAQPLRPGDADNRLKTLIDGLTRPANPQQLQGFAEPADGGPTYCLLDDDNRVTRIGLDTRMWHETGTETNDALVVVTGKLVLSPDADGTTPVATLFFLVS